MNGVMNRKLLFVLGPVTGLVMFAAVVMIATFLTNREYKEPYRAPSAIVTRRRARQGLAAERAAAEATARATPYVEAEYRTFPVVGSRVAIWAVAQLHLLFAAFVLAVPIFALIIEAIGYKTGDKRYDRLAYEFTKLLSVSFSLTATFGAFLTFMLIVLYPKFTNYLMSVFSPTFLPYVLLFFLEAFFLYAYYYGWGKFHPLVHLGLGLGLNLVGTGIMLIANAWLTFMMSPAGISDSGAVISVADAIYNFTWMPINVHRVIANVAFGGSIAAAYAAFKFLQAESDEERAHYDWMGYIGNFVAIIAFLPLPFAGYWLAKEITVLADARAHDDGRGLLVALHHPSGPHRKSLPRGQLLPLARDGAGRGGAAVPEVRQVPARRDRALFHDLGDAAVNHCDGLRDPGDGRIGAPGIGVPRCHVREEHRREHSDPHDLHELPALPPDGEGRDCGVGEDGPCGAALHLRGRSDLRHLPRRLRVLVEASVRIGLSVPQVSAVLLAMVSITAIDIFLFRRPKNTGEVRWGRIPAISQDADLHRGHLHLAHGAHGLRAVRAPPALACLRRHSGQLARRLHAHPRLRDADRLRDRARSSSS